MICKTCGIPKNLIPLELDLGGTVYVSTTSIVDVRKVNPKKTLVRIKQADQKFIINGTPQKFLDECRERDENFQLGKEN